MCALLEFLFDIFDLYMECVCGSKGIAVSIVAIISLLTLCVAEFILYCLGFIDLKMPKLKYAMSDIVLLSINPLDEVISVQRVSKGFYILYPNQVPYTLAINEDVKCQ